MQPTDESLLASQPVGESPNGKASAFEAATAGSTPASPTILAGSAELVYAASMEAVTSALQGFSTRRLAKLSGVSVTAVSRTLRGLSRPTVETLTRLAAALAVSLQDLVNYLDHLPASSTPAHLGSADHRVIGKLGPNARRVITLRTRHKEMPTSEIALTVGISPTRVRQILEAHRRRSAVSLPLPAIAKSKRARRSNNARSTSPAHVRGSQQQ